MEYKFTWDTFTRAERTWPSIFNVVNWDAGQKKLLAEIGCFEGRSTVWILENLVRHPDSRLYCIDPFTATGRKEQEVAQRLNIDWETVVQRFTFNVSLTGKANQVELMRLPSAQALSQLVGSMSGMFDFIYVDGSHRAPDALSDLIFSYHLLKDGGLMICDDYLWTLESVPADIDVLSNPKIAIDAFATIFRQTVIPVVDLPIYQVAFLKKALP